MNLMELIKETNRNAGTDLHIVTGFRPTYRNRNGNFAYLSDRVLSTEDVKELFHPLLDTEKKEYLSHILDEQGDVDLAYTVEQEDAPSIRCRINIFKEDHGLAGAIRLFKLAIPTRQELRIPTVTERLIQEHNGLIIFTAPTGNGKTTSIASLLNKVKETMDKSIITLEDPVEYQFPVGKSIISQREVGLDCPSFAHGLKAALREDPDIIFVGEMRDRDTILTALSAAETGHLVFTTLHAANVVEAVDRVSQYFEAEEQQAVRMEFANALLAILAQQLLPKIGGGKVAAFEVLINTPAIANIIRSGKSYAIPGYMDRTKDMQHMEESIDELRVLKLIE